jgi:hypothetical protein
MCTSQRRKKTADDQVHADHGPQQHYDHRLRNLAQRTGNVAVATSLGVPRSTARVWLLSAGQPWSA